jgi:hypothetical protein
VLAGVMRCAAVQFRSGEVTHDDICDALRVPATGNDLALAALRRGPVPGWFAVVPAPPATTGTERETVS